MNIFKNFIQKFRVNKKDYTLYNNDTSTGEILVEGTSRFTGGITYYFDDNNINLQPNTNNNTKTQIIIP